MGIKERILTDITCIFQTVSCEYIWGTGEECFPYVSVIRPLQLQQHHYYFRYNCAKKSMAVLLSNWSEQFIKQCSEIVSCFEDFPTCTCTSINEHVVYIRRKNT